MGVTQYVTLSTREYCLLQRIVGSARATIKASPSHRRDEWEVLDNAVRTYLKHYGTKREGAKTE